MLLLVDPNGIGNAFDSNNNGYAGNLQMTCAGPWLSVRQIVSECHNLS